jgi:SAM-dependent MidA family methyltransferase
VSPPATLTDQLIERIARDGPISVAEFMEACLHDPRHGYYQVRPALGADGDFITAPHVSQMFGELLGAWAAEVWTQLGRPPRTYLVELGPGDGTLMNDVLRAATLAPGFRQAIEVILVETSPPLREIQAGTLDHAAPRWLERVRDIPDNAPVIILANEFLDCLPIHQWVMGEDGWRQRQVGIDAQGRLAFVTGGRGNIFNKCPPGTVIEISPVLGHMGSSIAHIVAKATGVALFIDYGRQSPFGDTLQAVRGHKKEGPLENPGVADLTARVNFTDFLALARAPGARAMPWKRQGEFLKGLGVEARAEALMRANPGQAAKIQRQLDRLIAPDQMGDLFRAACVCSAGLAPPGFDPR